LNIRVPPRYCSDERYYRTMGTNNQGDFSAGFLAADSGELDQAREMTKLALSIDPRYEPAIRLQKRLKLDAGDTGYGSIGFEER